MGRIGSCDSRLARDFFGRGAEVHVKGVLLRAADVKDVNGADLREARISGLFRPLGMVTPVDFRAVCLERIIFDGEIKLEALAEVWLKTL